MPANYLGNNLLKGLDVKHKFTKKEIEEYIKCCLLYTSPSPRD